MLPRGPRIVLAPLLRVQVAFFWLGIAGSVVFGLAFLYTFSKYRKFEENHARTTEPLLPSSKYDE